MLDKVDTTNLNEFHNKGFDSNIAKFLDYHEKTEDLHISITAKPERIPQVVRNKGMERFEYFQSVKNKPNFATSNPQSKSAEKQKQKNFSLVYVDKSLMKLPSEIIEKQRSLTILDISRNKFEYFPLEIIQIQTLKVLKLDHNKIKCIPSEITKLPNLEVLSLGHNYLQSLPLSLSKLAYLRELNIEHNLLDYFSDEVTCLKNLKLLNITGNRFTYFPSSFVNLVSLNELRFEWFKYVKPAMNPIQKGDDGEQMLRKLMAKCAEYNTKNMKGLSFLEFVELFSEDKIDLMALDSQNRSILHLSSIQEDISVIRYLISYVPELIDLLDKDSLTAFCSAIQKDKNQAARYLLKHGANPTRGGGHNGSALHMATKHLQFNIVKDILKFGENPNRIDLEGCTPLHHCAVLMSEGHSKAYMIAQILLDQGANPNARNKENWTPLHVASRRRCARAILWILSYNLELKEIHGRDEVFKINKRGGGYKWTALHIAAYAGSYDCVQALGEAYADPFKRSVNGYTPKRVINKPGLTLKMVEKYEQRWVKEHIFFRKNEETESLAHQNLQNLNKTKEIKNASKNKFGEATIIPNDYETRGYFGYFFKTKVRMFAPLLGSGPVSKRDDEDSFEISPETEADSFDRHSDEENYNPEDMGDETDDVEENPIKRNTAKEDEFDNDTTQLDFCNDLNEDVVVGQSQFVRGIKSKDVKPSVISQSLTNQQQASSVSLQKGVANNSSASGVNVVPQYRSMKSKNNLNYQQLVTVDIENYEEQLKNEGKFDLNFCKAELKNLKEAVLSDRVPFSDKLKIFTALRILHRAIIENIYKNYNIPVSKDSFAMFVLKESLNRAKKGKNQQTSSAQAVLQQAFVLFECVPQSLMGFYLSINTGFFENLLLKREVCALLCELQYFPAIDFLETVFNNDNEDSMVKFEAKKAYNTLKGLMDPCRLTKKQYKEVPQLMQQQQKLFTNLPQSKTLLTQMERLDKWEAANEVLRTEENLL